MNSTNILTTAPPSSPFKWWYVPLLFIVINFLSTLLGTAGFTGDFAFYNSFKLPAVAPPDWLFPIAWAANNIAALIGLYYVVNDPQIDPSKKRQLFWSEGIFWTLFVLFGLMYFALQSPILAAANTCVSFVVTLVTMDALRRSRSRLLLFWVPRFLWLSLAIYVGIYMALANKDALFQVGPFF